MKATRNKTPKPIGDRLWPRLEATPTGCLEFQGKKSQNGYGRISLGRRSQGEGPAHRVAWELANGQTVPEGMVVCHRCDNPPCCNPDHLFVGTPAENTADMLAKGRARIGTAHHNAILTPDLVRAIRRLSSEGVSQRKIAARIGVSQGCVSAVLTRRLWSHVSDGAA